MDGFTAKILKEKEIIDNITDLFRLKEELAEQKELAKLNKGKKEVESDKYFGPIGKTGKKYLDIKQKELAAAKSENFIQANYFKRQCDLMEKEEIARFTNERNKKIESKVNILKEKQNKEKKSLKQN